MSVTPPPAQPFPHPGPAPWYPAPDPGPPPLSAARGHSVVALCVIGAVGLFGALLAWFSASSAGSGCSDYWAQYAPGRNPFCGFAYYGFVAYSTPIAVALACGLAVVGIVRARPGGHHLWPIAAWTTYLGFCVVWWLVFLRYAV